MIAAALRRHTLAFAAVALFSGGAMADGLESVSSVETAALPSMPAQIANPGLIAIDGRAVAFEPTHLWVLDVDRRAWASMDAALPASHAIVRAAASDGDVAVLLLGDVETDVVTRAATVGFAGDGLTMRELPQLPFALSSAFGATRGRALFVAGIDAENTPRLLQLSVTSDAGEWIEHAGWPGDAVPVSLIFQNSAVYLLAQSPGEPTQQMLRWSGKGGWQPMDPPPTPIVRGSGRAIGQSHVLYMASASEASRLVSLHTISGSWADLPYRNDGRILAVAPWSNGILTATQRNGEIGFEAVQLQSRKSLLSWFDWSVVIVYLAAMVGMGLYFHFRDTKDSAAEFFVGSRSIPVWAAGVSLYATNTSSISYIAIPAKSFETNWQYLSNNLVTVFGLMFVATWIVPLLRRLDLVSVFSYLEMRFHPGVRMLASGALHPLAGRRGA